jgi:hypothetical protein
MGNTCTGTVKRTEQTNNAFGMESEVVRETKALGGVKRTCQDLAQNRDGRGLVAQVCGRASELPEPP